MEAIEKWKRFTDCVFFFLVVELLNETMSSQAPRKFGSIFWEIPCNLGPTCKVSQLDGTYMNWLVAAPPLTVISRFRCVCLGWFERRVDGRSRKDDCPPDEVHVGRGAARVWGQRRKGWLCVLDRVHWRPHGQHVLHGSSRVRLFVVSSCPRAMGAQTTEYRCKSRTGSRSRFASTHSSYIMTKNHQN
jgi:hypothetical protein